jgi:hypothetical protein
MPYLTYARSKITQLVQLCEVDFKTTSHDVLHSQSLPLLANCLFNNAIYQLLYDSLLNCVTLCWSANSC